MFFENIMRRTNVRTLKNFLLYGHEDYSEASTKPYSERISEAKKNAMTFFQQRFPDPDEYDEIAGYFAEQVEVYEDVYFEMGLILGAKLGFELNKKVEDLSKD